MAAIEAQLRDALLEAINDRQTASGFVRNDFVASADYVPRDSLKTLATPRVRLVAMAASSEDILTRSRGCQRTLSLQLDLLAAVDPTDLNQNDTLLELLGQLRDVARTLTGWAWQRTLTLVDPNGLPYDLVRLREANVFESAIQPYYLHHSMP